MRGMGKGGREVEHLVPHVALPGVFRRWWWHCRVWTGVLEDAGTIYINPAAVSDLYTARPDSAIAFDIPVTRPAPRPGPRRVPSVRSWVPVAEDGLGRAA